MVCCLYHKSAFSYKIVSICSILIKKSILVLSLGNIVLFLLKFGMSIMKKNSTKQISAVGIIAIFTLGLSACATKPIHYNAHEKLVMVNGVPSYYIVRSGDTLSKISKQYGLDYRKVAMLNSLDSNYTIYVGQRLRLLPASASQMPNNQVITTTTPATVTTTTRTPVIAPSQSSVTTYTPPPVTYKPPVNTPPPIPNVNQKGWTRPSSGNIIRSFNKLTGVKGTWFDGQTGTTVVASKAGKILYAGNQLPEYGNLIMIRHDNDYVSAYAHLEQFSVKEGDVVQAGQQIGTMGFAKPMNRPALEFQIRYRGSPTNPAEFFR